MSGTTEKILLLSKNSEHLTEGILSVFAILNIIPLVMHHTTLKSGLLTSINNSYTVMTIIVLLFGVISHVAANRIDIHSIRSRIPDILFIFLGLSLPSYPIVFQLYVMVRQAYLASSKALQRSNQKKRNKMVTNNPAFFVLLSFLIAILIGTGLLLMPISSTTGNTTTLTGALFTATSATCVTGLVVYDTGTHFSRFGQIVILILIQIGGLGIMTISTSFAILTGQRLSLRGVSIMQNVIDEVSSFDMLRLIKNIILVTFLFEIVGMVSLFTAFINNYSSVGEAIFSSVFHSISAFCNAGFSLYPDSFMRYHGHLTVNLTTMILIILGGIGFSVLVDLRRNLLDKFQPSRFTLHSKIVVITTSILLLLGFLLFFVAEYNHTMTGFSIKDRILGSLFQSVTTRTAGFNTIETAELSESSSFISMILMFIGASPGSTGGGIKTTSFAIIILSVIAILTGNKDVVLFKRKIAESLIKRVMALVAVSMTLLFFVIFMLMMLEPFSFEHLIFEAFSAFGTVGLSMGITPHLTEAGRILITMLMYFGRVGPLTFIFALSRFKLQSGFLYSEEKISVG
jgi:trk system potassium uptake protein